MMLKLRLTNRINWAYEFFAIDDISLEKGCNGAWNRYKYEFGEKHLIATYQISTKIAEIELWYQKELKKWKHRPEVINAKKGQYFSLVFKCKKEQEIYIMPEKLELHVASIDASGWCSSGQYSLKGNPGYMPHQPHLINRIEKNNYPGLWTACKKSYEHDKMMSGFLDFCSKNDIKRPSLKLHLSCDAYQI